MDEYGVGLCYPRLQCFYCVSTYLVTLHALLCRIHSTVPPSIGLLSSIHPVLRTEPLTCTLGLWSFAIRGSLMPFTPSSPTARSRKKKSSTASKTRCHRSLK